MKRYVCVIVAVMLVMDQPIGRGSRCSAKLWQQRSGASGLTLVENGKPTSVIVTNGRPNETQSLAAAELQEHLRIMSGATIPIVKETELSRTSHVRILVGPSKLAMQRGVNTKQLEPESFIVRTTNDALVLAGEDRTGSNPHHGTLWAAYDFLQDQFGCRWIWPGEIGRVVPRRSTVTVGKLDIQETPTIKIRGFRMAAQEKHKVAYQKEGLDRFLARIIHVGCVEYGCLPCGVFRKPIVAKQSVLPTSSDCRT